VVVGALGFLSRSAAAWTLDHEEISQRTYRFALRGRGASAGLTCEVNEGWVSSLSEDEARLEMLRRRPEAGAIARCRCEVIDGTPPGSIALAIEDGFAPGGLPGRIVQRVLVDDRIVLVHDLAAEPGTAWLRVPLSGDAGAARRVTVEIEALRPTGPVAWGDAAATNIRVVGSGERGAAGR